MTVSMGERCSACGEQSMPSVKPGSLATARACQRCGHVEELREQPDLDPAPPEKCNEGE